MKKIVFFDFDGVLVDSFEISYLIAQKINPGLTKEQQKELFDGNFYDNLELKKGKSAADEDNSLFYKEYIPELMKLSPIENISQVLKELKNIYRLIVVSSTISSPIAEYLLKYNLGHYFEEILGGDIHKSKVTKIQMMLEKHKVKSVDSVFITDTLGDMKEAMECNVQSIGVTWGFHEKERLQKGNPFAIVENPEELLEAIRLMLDGIKERSNGTV